MKEKPKVSIYYDRDCGFCKRSVELISRYGLVRTKKIAPVEDDRKVFELRQKYDSWVVENEKGEYFTTFQAGVEIARHSSYLWIFVPLAKPRFMQRFGEWVYRKVASNRSRIWLP